MVEIRYTKVLMRKSQTQYSMSHDHLTDFMQEKSIPSKICKFRQSTTGMVA